VKIGLIFALGSAVMYAGHIKAINQTLGFIILLILTFIIRVILSQDA